MEELSSLLLPIFGISRISQFSRWSRKQLLDKKIKTITEQRKYLQIKIRKNKIKMFRFRSLLCHKDSPNFEKIKLTRFGHIFKTH